MRAVLVSLHVRCSIATANGDQDWGTPLPVETRIGSGRKVRRLVRHTENREFSKVLQGKVRDEQEKIAQCRWHASARLTQRGLFQQGIAEEGNHFIHRASRGLAGRIYQVAREDGVRRLSPRLHAGGMTQYWRRSGWQNGDLWQGSALADQ